MFIEQKMQERAIEAVRALSVAGVEKAKSGHPGLPLGLPRWLLSCGQTMKHNPANPDWFNRDRFVYLRARLNADLLFAPPLWIWIGCGRFESLPPMGQ